VAWGLYVQSPRFCSGQPVAVSPKLGGNTRKASNQNKGSARLRTNRKERYEMPSGRITSRNWRAVKHYATTLSAVIVALLFGQSTLVLILNSMTMLPLRPDARITLSRDEDRFRSPFITANRC
jgi:hypothetical protein